MANFWEESSVNRRPWQPIAIVRYFYLFRLAVYLVCPAFAVYGVLLIGAKSKSIATVYVTSETGRVAMGVPSVFAMTGERVQPYITDVLTALYTRTEEGRVISDMAPFADPIILRTIDAPFRANTLTDAGKEAIEAGLKAAKPYTVDLTVMGVKFRSANTSVMQVSFQTLLTTHTDESEYTSSVVYFDTRWDRVPATHENPLGWKLTGIVPSTENLYNKDEILEDIKRNTAIVTDVPLPASVSTSETSTPVPVKGVDGGTTISVPKLGDEN